MVIHIEALSVVSGRRHFFRRRPSKNKEAWVLQALDASFSTGVTLLLGPTGAGKSALLRVLAGVITPSEGGIYFNGQAASRAERRARVGYLPQNVGFYPDYTAGEMLHYIALLKNIVEGDSREKQVSKVLQMTAFAVPERQKIGTYSSGMRQKLGIAQALLGEPSILLFDEPFTSLDPEEKNKMGRLLVELGRTHVVVVTSALTKNVGLADRILILRRGKFCFCGTAEELADRGKGTGAAEPLAAPGSLRENWEELWEKGYRTVLQER